MTNVFIIPQLQIVRGNLSGVNTDDASLTVFINKMEYKGLYKSRPNVSVAGFSAKISQTLNAERLEKQRELFWGARVVLDDSIAAQPQPVEKKKNPRVEMLQKWKAEKMKKLEEEKKKQKPVFKVGIVQRKATGSPLITQPKTYLKKNFGTQQTLTKPNSKTHTNDPEPKRQGILTRAKAKKIGVKPKLPETKPEVKRQKSFKECYKYEGGKRKQIDSHVFKVPEAVAKLPYIGLTFPCSPKLLRRSQRGMKTDEKEVKVYTPKPEERVKESREHVKSAQKEERVKAKPVEVEKDVKDLAEEEKENKEVPQTRIITPEKGVTETDDYRPIHYSPFVTVRSGKKSKRKSKKSLKIDVDEQIKKEENEFKCRIFSFRKFIECETKRLLEMCDKWKHIYQEFQEVPTDVEGDIDSVIGKTSLLTSDKFMQFKGLIDKCENGDPFVKVDDLQGFQDWVSIEVEKIDGEFYSLEKRKCNNWKSEIAGPQDPVKIPKVKVPKNGTKKPMGKSQIRSHILAARKLLKEGNANGGEGSQLPTLTFELAVKATTPKKKESLLKDVLNSETKKKNESSAKKSPFRERRNSGLEIMMATQKNKFPTPAKLQKSPLLTDFEILIGTADTPSKSILKKTPKTLSSSKGHVTFEKQSENLIKRGRGLSEKYFRPVTDDEASPLRTILGDLGNVTPGGMNTRSRSRQLSQSFMNQQVN